MTELLKDSNAETLKNYFTHIHELYTSGETYPINLDDIWPLAYERKDHAVRALKQTFYDIIDYVIASKDITQLADNQVFPQNEKNSNMGRKPIIYMLTVPCMEYLIVRNNREIFEVYSKIFHKVIQGDFSKGTIDDKIKIVEAFKRLVNIGDATVTKMLNEVSAEIGGPTHDYVPAKGFPLAATTLLQKYGYGISPQKFNQLAKEKGFLQSEKRESSKKDKKPRTLWYITDKGLEFGENHIFTDHGYDLNPDGMTTSSLN